jgi:Domain of unknown function DUF29
LADFEAVHSDVSSDYYSWLLRQAAALRSRRHDLLDWDKLAEELESMAVSEERELLSQLKRLFVHLLKLQYQRVNEAVVGKIRLTMRESEWATCLRRLPVSETRQSSRPSLSIRRTSEGVGKPGAKCTWMNSNGMRFFRSHALGLPISF